jgi:hypothetical protein
MSLNSKLIKKIVKPNIYKQKRKEKEMGWLTTTLETSGHPACEPPQKKPFRKTWGGLQATPLVHFHFLFFFSFFKILNVFFFKF